jgi:hypothetical protein
MYELLPGQLKIEKYEERKIGKFATLEVHQSDN